MWTSTDSDRLGGVMTAAALDDTGGTALASTTAGICQPRFGHSHNRQG